MKNPSPAPRALLLATLVCSGALCAQESMPGGDVASLLSYAREHNPDYAAMRYEAQAAQERIESAGALSDPRFRTTLSDITRMGEQNPSVLPGRVGKTSYLVMQDVPWFGKLDLKREMPALKLVLVNFQSVKYISECPLILNPFLIIDFEDTCIKFLLS